MNKVCKIKIKKSAGNVYAPQTVIVILDLPERNRAALNRTRRAAECKGIFSLKPRVYLSGTRFLQIHVYIETGTNGARM